MEPKGGILGQKAADQREPEQEPHAQESKRKKPQMGEELEETNRAENNQINVVHIMESQPNNDNSKKARRRQD